MKINIVWLKRDIRTRDHAPFKAAIESGLPFVALYVYEDINLNYQDFDIRHARFIWQSLKSIENIPLSITQGDIIEIMELIKSHHEIDTVFSHQETGLEHTYERDKEFKRYCDSHQIKWTEFQQHGVERARRDRIGWDKSWLSYMLKQLETPDWQKAEVIHLENLPVLNASFLEMLNSKNDHMQEGGEKLAWDEFENFLSHRAQDYFGNISYPEKSRYYCSRLSAYISWGNISVRQIYQRCRQVRDDIPNKRSFDQFTNRLKWHCHFMQKLEMQVDIEYKNLNCAFDEIRRKKDKNYLKSWKQGMTGFPLIDAAMRCVEKTGYLNFRLRALVVSFLTHHLWQPWQKGAPHLARMFLDYEPGIHYSQFQMQAGTTGINTIRIYNPVKQSLEKDKDAKFIKTWVPELSKLPVEFIHEPWKMSEMDQLLHEFKYGRDYPKRIIDHEKASEYARAKLWETKKSDKSKYESKEILKRHASSFNRNR